MIRSITIDGFQCHAHLKLVLDPHVTVLVGDNGVGKSAAVRALKWLCLNQWDGKADKMTHWDMEFAQVVAKFEKYVILRRKDKDCNIYQINDEKPLEAVGAGKVPDSIAKIINLSEENFQEQGDSAFWFHLTAGQMAKSLNKIVNLSSIDVSLENVASELRTARETVRVSQVRLEEARTIKISLSWVKEADQKLSKLEAQAASIGRTLGIIDGLTPAIGSLERLRLVKQNASRVIQSGTNAIRLGHEFYNLDIKACQIRSLIGSIELAGEKICRLKEKLTVAQKRLAAMPQICQACGRPLAIK